MPNMPPLATRTALAQVWSKNGGWRITALELVDNVKRIHGAGSREFNGLVHQQNRPGAWSGIIWVPSRNKRHPGIVRYRMLSL